MALRANAEVPLSAEVVHMRKSALDQLDAMDAVAHAAVLAVDVGSDAAALMDTPDPSPQSQFIPLAEYAQPQPHCRLCFVVLTGRFQGNTCYPHRAQHD